MTSSRPKDQDQDKDVRKDKDGRPVVDGLPDEREDQDRPVVVERKRMG
jgi:hypothetical protein